MLKITGFLDLPGAQCLGKALADAIGSFRDAGQPLRLMADVRGMPIQARESAGHMLEPALYRPGDRVAVIVDTALGNISARRNLQALPHGVWQAYFDEPAAAADWLAQAD